MFAETASAPPTTRRVILRDSAAFSVLLCSTAVLFAITLFLFRSFTAHRAVLAKTWAASGSRDLEQHNAAAAIAALRTALVYAPGTRDYELLLAQALGESNCNGCRDESYSYYENLWETQPGSAPINLALARLARQRNDTQAAINFYRAAIYGTWEGNGVDRRAEVRLELAGYLTEAKNFSSARLELLTAGTNAPDNFDRNMKIAAMLQAADDRGDAFVYYRKAIADRPDDASALDAAAHVAYAAGDFEDAHRLFAEALEQENERKLDPNADQMMENARRLLELTPSPSLSSRELATRIADDRSIAKKRFDECFASDANSTRPAPPDGLDVRWSAPEGTATVASLMHDPALEDQAMQLVFDTETAAAHDCTPATGDDALLLVLATSPHHALPGADGTSPLAGSLD